MKTWGRVGEGEREGQEIREEKRERGFKEEVQRENCDGQKLKERKGKVQEAVPKRRGRIQ